MSWFGKDTGKNLGDPQLVAGYIPARQIIDAIKPGSKSLDVRTIAEYTRGIKLLRAMIVNTGDFLGDASPKNEVTSDFLETLDENGGVVEVDDPVPHTVGNLADAAKKYIGVDDFGMAKNRLNELYPRYDATRNAMFKTAVKPSGPGLLKKAGRKSRKLGNKFNRCVKSVRQTVRARPKSTKESAAIAICTKSVLQTRGLTMKRYRKKRLITQKKFRGGAFTCS